MKTAIGLLVLLSVSAAGQTTTVPGAVAAEPQFGSSCSYPEAALAAKEKGTTVVAYTGTQSGRIENIKVLRSSGHSGLDQAAVACVGRWRFDPNDSADKFSLGDHQLYIDWNPDSAKTGERPVGRYIGVPHSCFTYYPPREMAAGIEGVTTLRFTITEKGTVRDVTVDVSSGNQNLDAAAIRCAQSWRYRPATHNDLLVAVPWKATVLWHNEIAKMPDFAEPPPDCLHAYPVKPEDLAGIDGVTEIHFAIVHGEVQDVVVWHSSGNRVLDRVAAQCVSKRKYVRDTVIWNDRDVDRSKVIARERIVWRDALEAK